ncbi:hypothetical protein Lal_00022372 [Lupinus albus]|nr:hypothetical protein Lal_00022372 [Lupinus albus]
MYNLDDQTSNTITKRGSQTQLQVQNYLTERFIIEESKPFAQLIQDPQPSCISATGFPSNSSAQDQWHFADSSYMKSENRQRKLDQKGTSHSVVAIVKHKRLAKQAISFAI